MKRYIFEIEKCISLGGTLVYTNNILFRYLLTAIMKYGKNVLLVLLFYKYWWYFE